MMKNMARNVPTIHLLKKQVVVQKVLQDIYQQILLTKEVKQDIVIHSLLIAIIRMKLKIN